MKKSSFAICSGHYLKDFDDSSLERIDVEVLDPESTVFRQLSPHLGDIKGLGCQDCVRSICDTYTGGSFGNARVWKGQRGVPRGSLGPRRPTAPTDRAARPSRRAARPRRPPSPHRRQVDRPRRPPDFPCHGTPLGTAPGDAPNGNLITSAPWGSWAPIKKLIKNSF